MARFMAFLGLLGALTFSDLALSQGKVLPDNGQVTMALPEAGPSPLLAAPAAQGGALPAWFIKLDSVQDWAVKLVPLAVGLSLVLRGIADLLFAFAKLTRANSTSQAATVIARAAEVLAQVPGWFGFKVPSPMAIAMAQKLEAKNGLGNDTDQAA